MLSCDHDVHDNYAVAALAANHSKCPQYNYLVHEVLQKFFYRPLETDEVPDNEFARLASSYVDERLNE